MSHGARDYYFWDMPISVPNGGTGDTSLTLNGVLIGQGGNGIYVTAAGTPNQVLRVPSGGGTPAFATLGALADMATLDLSSAYVSNILPVAHGGTGTNTPGLTAGAGISIAWAWPGQLVTNTSAYATLADPLPVAHGGTGTTTPALVAGTGISITGVWPGQTINSTSNYATLADPLPVAHGGTGTTTPALVAGTGISISGTWPAQTITNTSAYATLGDPLPVAHGGTGTATPGLVAGAGISISGTWPAQTITNTSAYAALADPLPVAHGGTGMTNPGLTAGTGISIQWAWPSQLVTNTSAYATMGDPLPVGHGGSGTATPTLAQGVGISITGSWPGQTITNTSAYAALADPLPVAHGGTGTASPSLVAGGNIAITGAWPNQTVGFAALPIHFGPAGTPVDAAFDIGNSSSPGRTQFGSTSFTVSGIPGSLLGLANQGIAWLVAFDLSGNMGLAGALKLGTPLAVTSGGTGVASCSAGQHLLGTGSNTAAFVTPDGARVYNSGNESIATATVTTLTFNTERYNNGSMHSTTTNPSRLTCKTAGKFLITAHIEWAASGAGTARGVSLVANGNVYIASSMNPPSSLLNRMSVSTIWNMAVNDYVEVWVYQDSGGALNVSSVGNYSPEFAAQWLGP